ncbi:MAG: glycosyltransferase family protein [Patescibacteria group bacterium]
MKYLFFIQNEGRGHLTQALTVAGELRARGHQIIGAVLSDNPHRQLPTFFKEQLNVPIYFVKSPYFLKNKKQTGISLSKSIIFNLVNLPNYLNSARKVKELCKELKPDIILNFYEPVVGVYHLLYKNGPTTYSLGHQFFLDHPAFKKPLKQKTNHLFLSLYNKLVSNGSKYNLALSFTKETDYISKKIIVCPPLIRPEIKNSIPENKNFILSYLLNDGYCQEIITWAKNHENQKIEAFWDKKNEPTTKMFGSNLTFHQISGELFMDLLRSCSLYVATAGFESICEAAYLQKNILMVPTVNHYEQLCNAADAKRAGLAQSDSFFNIDLILDTNNSSDSAKQIFKSWVDKNSEKLINQITTL